MFEIVLNSLEDTKKFAYNFSKNLKKGDVVSLIGDLCAGKTALTKFIAKNLGIEDEITSPTFNIVNTYYGDIELNHLDLYRIDNPDELYQIDYENYFYPNGISIIEWAENGGYLLPKSMIEISIIKNADDTRKLLINGKNQRELEIIKEL